jgi:hypothetical protein
MNVAIGYTFDSYFADGLIHKVHAVAATNGCDGCVWKTALTGSMCPMGAEDAHLLCGTIKQFDFGIFDFVTTTPAVVIFVE